MKYDLWQYDLNNIMTDDVVSEIMGKIGAPALDALHESIDDIQKLIEEREKLHKDMMKDLEDADIDLNGFINQIMTGRRRDETALKDIATLKAKAVDLAQAKKDEKLSCWQDISKLKEELRQAKREMQERQSRANLLDSILTDK